MSVGRKQKVVGAKVTLAEKRLIEAASAADGVTVSAFIYGLILPAARSRVASEFGLEARSL